MKSTNLKTNNLRPGKLLIASPFLNDKDFERTVILLITCDNGHMGVVINKELDWGKTVNKLIDELKDAPEIPVYNGGVVDKDVLFCIHNNPLLKDSLCIGNGLYVNGDFTEISKMMTENTDSSIKARFFLGYAGWSEGQLEQEVEQGNWAVTDADSNKIFSDDIHQLWHSILNNIEEPYCYWAQLPPNPLFN